jgi:predicted dienelactone hydrolase
VTCFIEPSAKRKRASEVLQTLGDNMFNIRKLALVAATLLVASTASAQFQKGPNPTASALERTGSFATRTGTVSSLAASCFGGGNLYYPTTTGTYGAIALCPGFTASASSIGWLGTRLASHGFVVLIIETNSTLDQPGSRARQLESAVNYLKAQNTRTGSVLRNKIDVNRVAIGGHSMGGGGTLEAAQANPSYKAAVPLTPWHTTKSFRSLSVPTLIIGGSSDTVAPNADHSVPFYTSIPSGTPRIFLELRGASHFFPQSADATVSRFAISWYKRFVDEDTRFSQFFVRPSTSVASDYRSGAL